MCNLGPGRDARTPLMLVALALLALATPAVAQSAIEARRELDSLIPELRAATAVIEEAERARRRDAGAISIERGHLRLSVDASIASQTASAAAMASASLDRVFGDQARLASAYVIGARLQPVRVNGEGGHVIRVRRFDPDSMSTRGAAIRRAGEERVVAVGDPEETDAGLVAALEAVAAVPLHASLDDDLRLWFRTALSATAETPEELENTYIDLTTASTEVSRRCLMGDVRGCRQVLGLAPLADPILEAYTTTDRRTLVKGNAERLRLPAKAAEFDRCVVGADDTACIARLRDLPPESLWSAHSTTATRRSFARWAIALGGPGAYARLRTAPGLPLDERFGSAARLPGDSLVVSWHAHVMSARPGRSTLPPTTAFMIMLWIGVCGALALRSSRWR